jgi:opacity protein-like surface antigen
MNLGGDRLMRKLLIVVLAVFVPVLAASAQDLNTQDQSNVASVASATPAAAAPQVSGYAFPDWQVSLGYQYNSLKINDNTGNGSTFHTNGINASLTRYFKDWLGLEAQVGIGFGNTRATTFPNSLDAKSVFIGGGPHIAYRNKSRFEPWGHALFGMEHFRFTQTGGVLGSNTAFGWMGGGGLDYHFNSRMAIRGEGDYLGTHFFGATQTNFQAVAALVVNF